MSKSLNGRADRPYLKPDRAPRACLRCRMHKIRCNGHSNPGGQCTTCVEAKESCSYFDSVGHLNRTQKKYIESLEEKNAKLEALLKKLHPGEAFPELAEGKEADNAHPALGSTRSYTMELNAPRDPPTIQMVNDQRFYGKFSNPRFIRTVVDSKLKEKGIEWSGLLTRLREKAGKELRWNQMPAWQHQILYRDATYRLTFPPDDLMASLIENYFSYEHMFKPILHRPTFESMVRSRLHDKDQYFGALVLMVCACGARWSDDPRTRKTEDDIDSAGWLYYDQVHHLPRPMSEPVTLVRLQLFNLMLVFLHGTCLISLEWSIIGTGLRLAMDIGVHMNSYFANASTSERELWKRAFWGLFIADQLISSSLGRNCVIPPEDVDIDLPLEVDDEYWHPPDETKAFIQPLDKPSYISSFNAHIRLMCLMPKITQLTKDGLPQDNRAVETLAELDSSLNQWLESLPPHLQWNANHTNPIHFSQSSMLHAMYHEKIILIHRPFISLPEDGCNVAQRTTDLAFCTNAARAGCRVLHTFAHRIQRGGGAWVYLSAFNCLIILLLDVWSGGKDGAAQAVKEGLEAIERCEERHVIARVFRDVFQELLAVTDFSTKPKLTNGHANGTTAPQVIDTLPADPWWMEGFTETLPSTDYLVFPSADFPADFSPHDPVPVAPEDALALLQDWAQQAPMTDWSLWNFLSADSNGQQH